jgi:hypothetical protein
MSRELLEFSDMIDEQFDIDGVETEDFWELPANMFI